MVSSVPFAAETASALCAYCPLPTAHCPLERSGRA